MLLTCLALPKYYAVPTLLTLSEVSYYLHTYLPTLTNSQPTCILMGFLVRINWRIQLIDPFLKLKNPCGLWP